MRYARLKDGLFIVPTAVALGACFAVLQPGNFWIGWRGFAALFLIGGIALAAAVRWANGGRRLAWMTLIALVVRLGVGTALHLLLPMNGYDEPDDRTGYVFTDAHRRDDQAWSLASSDASLLSAFDRTYYTDQYGGLLAVSALSYRIFSPDAHRPLLVLALAAIAAALGVPFFMNFAARLLGPQAALFAAWLYSLYPESVLTGGAQMREPFLLSFIAVGLWGFALWLEDRSRTAGAWLAAGLVGLILVSPGVAIALVILLVVWLRAREEHARVPPVIWIGGAALFAAAFLFLVWSLDSRNGGGSTPVGIISSWSRDAVSWVIYQLERGSGQVQNVFSKLFPAAQFLFVVAYGITQPLLPPAFLEPTTATWHGIGIARSLGWYALLPLMVYAGFARARLAAGLERRVWTWLVVFSWLWILLSAIRAGGDQWDNPRYRLIFFGIQAAVAAMAWGVWRAQRDPWLPRILAAEGFSLLMFTQWYLARYYLIGIHLPVMVVMTLCIVGSIVIIVGGAIRDRLRGRMPRGNGRP